MESFGDRKKISCYGELRIIALFQKCFHVTVVVWQELGIMYDHMWIQIKLIYCTESFMSGELDGGTHIEYCLHPADWGSTPRCDGRTSTLDICVNTVLWEGNDNKFIMSQIHVKVNILFYYLLLQVCEWRVIFPVWKENGICSCIPEWIQTGK